MQKENKIKIIFIVSFHFNFNKILLLLEITSFGEEQIFCICGKREGHKDTEAIKVLTAIQNHCIVGYFSENGTEKSETTGNMKIFTVFVLFVFGAVGENLVENYDRELSTIKLLFYPK